MKQRKYAQDTFVVYSGDIIIATGTKEHVARVLKIDKRTVAWYATPRAHSLFQEGKIKRMAIRISVRSLEKLKSRS